MASTTQDKVRDFQRALYRAAKAAPKRRFHTLYDKLYRRDVLERGWDQVRRNRGAAGIDRQTIEQVETYGVDRLLGELEHELRENTYRPLPLRRVWIPKPGKSEQRPLSIPAVKDRVVQAVLKIVIEPVFEADFLPSSFGFRPKRAAHDALQVIIDESWKGNRWVVETDIASCFESIPHDGLRDAVVERIVDRNIVKLTCSMLRVGVMEGGVIRRSVAGTPQGGVVSPLLANIYLNRLDRQWIEEGCGNLVRYADDILVICRTKTQADQALRKLKALLSDLGLRIKESKTRIVHLREGGQGFDFLGFHHRYVRGYTSRSRHLRFVVRGPSKDAMQRARDRIRELTARNRLLVPVEQVVEDVNRFLRGWMGYFRYGNSAHAFLSIRNYALRRISLFVANRHRRKRGYGWIQVAYLSADQLGLYTLNGTVIAPYPNRPWRRQGQMPVVKRRR